MWKHWEAEIFGWQSRGKADLLSESQHCPEHSPDDCCPALKPAWTQTTARTRNTVFAFNSFFDFRCREVAHCLWEALKPAQKNSPASAPTKARAPHSLPGQTREGASSMGSAAQEINQKHVLKLPPRFSDMLLTKIRTAKRREGRMCSAGHGWGSAATPRHCAFLVAQGGEAV